MEGRLFMLFFLYKSGRGWTIPDRTSCVCCELITGLGEENKHGRPEGERGGGAGPPRRAHPGRARGADTERRQPRVLGDTGRGQGCWPGLPPEPHCRPGMGGMHPTALGHILGAPPAATCHPPSKGGTGDPHSLSLSPHHLCQACQGWWPPPQGVDHQCSTFWGIGEPPKIQDTRLCSGYCHPVPVMRKREVNGLGHQSCRTSPDKGVLFRARYQRTWKQLP